MNFKIFQRQATMPQYCYVSIGDILLQRGMTPTETQFITISRMMDVVQYYKNPLNYNFYYRNTICNAFHVRCDISKNNDNFRSLISSFQSSGFDNKYPITLDIDGKLYDGNHRCGICAYMGIDTIYAKILTDHQTTSHNIDVFIANRLPTNFIRDIYNEFYKFQKYLVRTRNTFAIKVSGLKNQDEIANFKLRLSFLCNILNIVKNRKNNIIFQFSTPNPDYYYTHNTLISKRCLKIEKILKRNWPELDIYVSRSCLEGRILCINELE